MTERVSVGGFREGIDCGASNGSGLGEGDGSIVRISLGDGWGIGDRGIVAGVTTSMLLLGTAGP